MSFAGMQVLSLESRRSAEIAELIRRQKGNPVAAPSMREAPLEQNQPVFEFAERLFAGEFEMMILLTGVGTRILAKTLATRYPPERFPETLRAMVTVARGPKPVAALREWGLKPTLVAPEPNTWRELLAVTEGRAERRIALQEYGRPNPELVAALRARGAQVTPVRVYRWELPEDTGPLREAARLLAGGQIDVALFTTSVQIDHLLAVAANEGLEEKVKQAFRRLLVASVGPTTTEALEEHGIPPDFEPSHPKMGVLVQETAAQAETLLQAKRSLA
ncbi:MAG: uroporphyrinogen-III synthase [Acidobacteria bacterium]|nr:uroporphyrinogen-III synthase [Acidobacteriota bacterium]